ncbi:hypothetical protein ID866_9139 [Astraeus odoratus]|nr:hypothetical protein ID866_9139 [Astraeus odoratus]
MDPSEIGRFGTLRLMKRQEPDIPIASFPIDDETVTFGRDPSCSVRLYYSSMIGTKLGFVDTSSHIQAFIVVLGSGGVVVDGCVVHPSPNEALPTTIPISNHSEIEIHKKRFVFTYPPKEMRTALYTSPQKEVPMTPGTRRKMLRMSMIQSAEVFTPRPSKDPMENLRILQSPLKRCASSPLKQHHDMHQTAKEEEEEEEEIVLVDGNHPHVVEEGKDLVILESVEVEVPTSQPSPTVPIRLGAFGRSANLHSADVNPYQTPRRKPARPSLHRAVLIRSAQRAVLRQEVEREEEEQEEKEVEEFIAEEGEDSMHDNEGQHDDESTDEEDDECDHDAAVTDQPSGWRKSLGLVKGFGWPFRSSSATPDEEHKEEEFDPGEDCEEVQYFSTYFVRALMKRRLQEIMDVNQELPPSSDSVAEPLPESDLSHEVIDNMADPAPAPRLMGAFMTPQVSRVPLYTGVGRGGGRSSFDGATAPSCGIGGPRRVRIEPKWKVTDIVVPLRNEEGDVEPVATRTNTVQVKQEEKNAGIPGSTRRLRATEEERQAIRERRRSALSTPDPYFGGQVPGLGTRRLSNAPGTSPAPLPSLSSAATQGLSPKKAQSLSPTKLAAHAEQSGSEEEEDTRSLLDRMKQTVEVMKRRRSIGPFSGEDEEPNPDRALVKDDQHATTDNQIGEGLSDDGSDKENAEKDIEMTSVKRTEGFGTANAAEIGLDTCALEEDRDDDAPADLPLPALTRQPANPQTPQLESLKHLFPQTRVTTMAATPAVQSMRHLFRNAPSEVETPPMDGVRMMFLREGRSEHLATPTFEGVSEMMQTPLAYRQDTSSVDDAPLVTKSDQPTKGKATAVAALSTTRRRTPRVNAGTSKAPAADPLVAREALAEDPAGPLVGSSKPQAETSETVPRKARLLRGRKLTPAVDEPGPSQEIPSSCENTELKATGARKIKAEPESVAPKRPPSRAKVTPISEVAKGPTRVTRSEPSKTRSRLTAKVAQPSSETPTETAQTKRGVRKGVATSGVRGGSGRTAPSESSRATDEDENDPLDSIRRTDDGPVLKRRTRTTTAPRVKEEEADPPAGPALRKRAPTPTAVKPGAPTATTRGKAAVATRKKAASTAVTKVPPESGSESGMDKENTPSREDSETSGQDALGSAPKATRGKRSGTVSKPKDVEKDESTKPRTTRATRSRT